MARNPEHHRKLELHTEYRKKTEKNVENDK
jgi:hypothetical protein